MSTKSPTQSLLIMIISVPVFLILLIPLFDSYFISNIASDIASPSGIQYLAYLPIVGLILLFLAISLLIFISKKVPPIIINVNHRKEHPNTADKLGEYIELSDTPVQKYHEELLFANNSKLNDNELQ